MQNPVFVFQGFDGRIFKGEQIASPSAIGKINVQLRYEGIAGRWIERHLLTEKELANRVDIPAPEPITVGMVYKSRTFRGVTRRVLSINGAVVRYQLADDRTTFPLRKTTEAVLSEFRKVTLGGSLSL